LAGSTVAGTDAAAGAIDALLAFASAHPRLFVLTGAGTSTASGIPGYRDADGQWTRAAPVMFQDFVRSEASRRRYWRRSLAGWPLIARARPNAAHRALARIESMQRVTRIATQNVDGLHERAGSATTIALHGKIDAVVCLDCATRFSRSDIQRELEAANPGFRETSVASAAPDGDADASDERDTGFVVPACAKCGGVLKPDVVFFGEGVPQPRVTDAREALERADAMLVVGSSLTVYSGYRFCEWAVALHKPIAAINIGRTRADPLLALKAGERCGPLLRALAQRLAAS
jgi:NAD-dependent SIR2 family protein deacetylase